MLNSSMPKTELYHNSLTLSIFGLMEVTSFIKKHLLEVEILSIIDIFIISEIKAILNFNSSIIFSIEIE